MPNTQTVKLNKANPRVNGSRSGTAIATKAKLVELFGEPENPGDFDGKVTMRWVFDTPDGPVELRDYWSNSTDEWSIASGSLKADEALIAFLNENGIEARKGK